MNKVAVQQQLLSTYFKSGKKTVKNNKVNLFGKNIMFLDRVESEEEQLLKVIEMDLSHNSIHTIEDVSGFKNLEMINLCHNKISDVKQVQKLGCLKKMHSLLLKKNPFAKEEIPYRDVRFILSLQTDVNITSYQIPKKIIEITNQKTQILCFENYLNKLRVHAQLLNQYQMEGTLNNASVSIFPRIKNILEQFYEKNIKVRRQFVERIPEQIFINEKQLNIYLNQELQSLKLHRSSIIKKIYELQQMIKNHRTGQNFKKINIDHIIEQERKSPQKQVNISTLDNALREHKKSVNQKMKNTTNNMKNISFSSENSPIRSVTDMSDIKDSEQFESQFMNILCKLNPLYHLLHSPLTSLKSNEKQMLIQNMVNLLKEKMKDNFKLQKVQKSYVALQNEFSALQEQKQSLISQFHQEQGVSVQKIKKLTKLYREETQKLEARGEELEKVKNNFVITENENNKLTRKIREKDLQLQKIREYEQNEEIILSKREFKIKSDILKKINKKAYHFNQLRKLREINQRYENDSIKQNVFESFKNNLEINRSERNFQNYFRAKIGKRVIKNLIISVNAMRNKRMLKKRVQNVIKHYYFNLMRSYFQENQMMKSKIQTLQKRKQRQVKTHLMQLLKRSVKQKNMTKLEEQVMEDREFVLVRKSFENWKIYISEHKDRECFLQKWRKLNVKSKALKQFICNSRKQVKYWYNLNVLEKFIENYRKINGYLKFTKFMNRKLFYKTFKVIKIMTRRKHKEFGIFSRVIKSIIRSRNKKKEEKISKNQKEIAQAQKLLQNLETQRLSKLLKFQKILFNIRSKKQRNQLERSKKEISYIKQRNTKKVRCFLINFRSFFTKQMQMIYKLKLLRKTTKILGSFRKFYKQLSLRKQDAQNFQKIKEKKMEIRYFYRWKTYVFWQKMQRQKMKFITLGPEIDKITVVQKQLGLQRELMQEQLQKKQLLLDEYMRKCAEYEFLINSKDIKHQRLKQIYSQITETQQLCGTVKKTISKFQKYRPVRDENIYLKYLPPQIQKTARTAMTIKEGDNILKNMKDKIRVSNENYEPENKRFEYSYDYNEYSNGQAMKNTSFLQSFRKF